jgi:hypothetical protein
MLRPVPRVLDSFAAAIRSVGQVDDAGILRSFGAIPDDFDIA